MCAAHCAVVVPQRIESVMLSLSICPSQVAFNDSTLLAVGGHTKDGSNKVEGEDARHACCIL